MKCPACDSDGTRRVSVVWEEGTYTQQSTASTTTKIQSHVYGGGGMGALSGRQTGTTHTTTTGMSELARRVARPEPETPLRDALKVLGISAVSIFFGGAAVAGIVSEPLAFVLMPVASALVLYWVFTRTSRGLRYNRNEFPGLLEKWRRSWWCSKCGEVFEGGA